MKFLGKLVLWQKLLLIVVALLVPSALLSIFYLKSANDTVRQANAELTGARYTRELDEFLFEVIRHRAMASVVLNGDATRKDAVTSTAAAVDNLRLASRVIGGRYAGLRLGAGDRGRRLRPAMRPGSRRRAPRWGYRRASRR